MRSVVRVVVAVLSAALLAACGARPQVVSEWAEPQMATPQQYRIADSSPRGAALMQAAREWVETGSVPGEGTKWESMSRWALIDLHQALGGMSVGHAPAAGAAERWNYFWPRDGAFLVVALDRTGHQAEAQHLIDFMAKLPFDPTAGFDARYLVSGKRVTVDPRGPQSDGCGWVLWALGSVSDASMPKSANGLRTQCLANVLKLTWSGWLLPPASPDYWEISVKETSLGTVAPMLAGLRATADHSPVDAERRSAGQAATHLEAQVSSSMGPSLERFGDHGGLDAAIAMMMPPFGPGDRRTTKAWLDYQRLAVRSSGGLAPGVEWKQDGTSWTPESALVAYTAAASGRKEVAAHWLDWLDDNRTPWGSLPEKVNRSGQPAGPAPLLWTAALVLLTLDSLES